MIAVGDS